MLAQGQSSSAKKKKKKKGETKPNMYFLFNYQSSWALLNLPVHKLPTSNAEILDLDCALGSSEEP